jgi:hypothetical protein
MEDVRKNTGTNLRACSLHKVTCGEDEENLSIRFAIDLDKPALDV